MPDESQIKALELEIEKLRRELQESKKNQQELLRHKQQIDAIFDNAPAEIYLKDHEGRYLKINRQFEKIFGVKNEDLVGKFPDTAHDSELAASTRAQDLAVLNTGQIITREEKARLVIDDQIHTLFTIKFPVFGESGEITGLGAVVTDISEQKAAEAKFRTMFMSAPIGITLSEGENAKILEVNPAYAQIVGREIDEVVRLGWQAFTHPDDLDEDVANVKSIHKGGSENRKATKRYIKPDGSIVWVERTMTAIEDMSTSTKKLFLSVFEDITERKHFEEKIWHQAHYDFLTNLPNRSMFQDRMTQLINRGNRDGTGFALVLVDLDEFKQINDSLGHDQGDQLLRETARRISHCLRESDTVARLGGDEFVVILPGLTKAIGIDKVVNLIGQSLNQPFDLGGDVAHVSASMGITVFPGDAQDLKTIMKNADQAMYQAKALGRNRHYYFKQMMQEDVENRAAMISFMNSAIDAEEFQIYYQPIVKLDSDEVYKAEALIRWHHPQHNLLLPEDFIPISEETLFINKIGDWVFKQTASLAKKWRESIHHEFQISINISAVQFDRQIEIYWRDFLESQTIEGNSICLEIGKAFLTSGKGSVAEKLREFHKSGVEISLDDFGSNHSSLTYIRKLDIDYLKIGQSYVDNLTLEAANVDVCAAIIIMAHRLGIKVIAEGIETEKQRSLLKSIGCDYGQGFLFSQPISAEDFENQYGGSVTLNNASTNNMPFSQVKK